MKASNDRDRFLQQSTKMAQQTINTESNMQASRKWNQEQKDMQAEKIRQWRPWEKSTGPKTVEGKAVSAMNACRGYWRRRLRYSAWLLQTRKHSPKITPSIILETYRRAEKLDCFTDEDLKYWLNQIKSPC